MQGVETVERADNKHGEDHYHGREVVRLLDGGSPVRRVEQQYAAPAVGQTNRADREPEHLDGGNDQRRYIYRAVLPQLPPNRPVERSSFLDAVAGGADPGPDDVRFHTHLVSSADV